MPCATCGCSATVSDGLIHGPVECFWRSFELYTRWKTRQEKPEPEETRDEELARRRREGTVIRMLGVEITGDEADAISADGP